MHAEVLNTTKIKKEKIHTRRIFLKKIHTHTHMTEVKKRKKNKTKQISYTPCFHATAICAKTSKRIIRLMQKYSIYFQASIFSIRER